jgi:hypothetical protein
MNASGAGFYRITLPGNPEPSWVRVRSPGGQVRWRLADDVELA